MYEYGIKRQAAMQDLGGAWLFKADKNNIGKKEAWENTFPNDAITMPVPSCWNNTPAYYDYTGVGYYKKEFFAKKGNAKIIFEGVSNYCTVYLDGEEVLIHKGAYTGFCIYTNFKTDGTHTLVVRTDAYVDDENTVPNETRDWKVYGGIIRPVYLISLPEFFVDDLCVHYTLSEDLHTANAVLEFSAYGEGIHTYTLFADDKALKTTDVQAGKNKIAFTLENIRLWNVLAPQLYTFSLESDTDAASVRTGFRKVAVNGRRIEVNNKPVYLRGVNRHEDHPEWGHALPLHIAKKDMDIIVNMGCNMIRGSHYPNSRAFLDLCDEYGILFWSELPLWYYKEKQAANEDIVNTILKMGHEMIVQNYNHPSIFTWGLHNECETSTKTFLRLTEKMATQYRTEDPSRLITYASDKVFDDICFKVCDFICVNRYPGWYGDEVEEWESFFNKFNTYLKEQNIPELPIMISEFGGGGIYGQSSFESPKWSEQYQCEILEKSMEIFRKHPEVGGMMIWQYCDIRVRTAQAMSRPRTFNNKGLVNEYRQPKMAYYTAKKLYEQMAKEDE